MKLLDRKIDWLIDEWMNEWLWLWWWCSKIYIIECDKWLYRQILFVYGMSDKKKQE